MGYLEMRGRKDYLNFGSSASIQVQSIWVRDASRSRTQSFSRYFPKTQNNHGANPMPDKNMKVQFLALTVFLVSFFSASSSEAQTARDDVRRVVVQFHEALAGGDSAAVSNLLAPDLVILEGGRAETKTEYMSHHFHSDKAFLASVEKENEKITIEVENNVAWSTSTSRLYGSYREREIDSNSAELLVLKKTNGGWKIAAIHWSSGSRR